MDRVLLILILGGCAGPVAIAPDVHCTGEIEGGTVEDRVWDAVEDCAPMIRVTIDSYTGNP